MANLCYMKGGTKHSIPMFEKPLSEIDPEAAEGVQGNIRFYSKTGSDPEKKWYLPLVLPSDPRSSDLRVRRAGTILAPLGTNYIVGNRWVTFLDTEYVGTFNKIDTSFNYNPQVRDKNDPTGVNIYIKLTSTYQGSLELDATVLCRNPNQSILKDEMKQLGAVWAWADCPSVEWYTWMPVGHVEIIAHGGPFSSGNLTVKYLVKD